MMKHSIKQKCKYNIWLSCSNIMPLQRSFMKSALPFSCHIYWKKKFKYSSHAIQSFPIKIYYILSNGIHNGVNANVSAKKGMSMNMNNEHHHWQKPKRTKHRYHHHCSLNYYFRWLLDSHAICTLHVYYYVEKEFFLSSGNCCGAFASVL